MYAVVSLKYKVEAVYEILYFVRKGYQLRPFYRQVYLERLKCSLPKNGNKADFSQECNRVMDLHGDDRLKPEDFCTNPGYKKFCKNILNFSIGK